MSHKYKEGEIVSVRLNNGDRIKGSMWGYPEPHYMEIEELYDNADRKQPIAVSLDSQEIKKLSRFPSITVRFSQTLLSTCRRA